MALNKEALSEVVTELTQSLEILPRAFYMGEQEPDLQVWEPGWDSTSWAFGRKGFQVQEPPAAPPALSPGFADLPSQPCVPQGLCRVPPRPG